MTVYRWRGVRSKREIGRVAWRGIDVLVDRGEGGTGPKDRVFDGKGETGGEVCGEVGERRR